MLLQSTQDLLNAFAKYKQNTDGHILRKANTTNPKETEKIYI